MNKLGLLLACEHYPSLSANDPVIDAQLRHWLAHAGTTFDAAEVFETYINDLPRHAAECDAWILSGVPLATCTDFVQRGNALEQFLRAAASFGRPIYAINHGEHVLHQAVAAFYATPPATPPTPRSIQNPFRSFHSGYTLHRFNPTTRRVESIRRPDAICPRRLFGALRRAA